MAAAAEEPEVAPGWLPPRPTDRQPVSLTKAGGGSRGGTAAAGSTPSRGGAPPAAAERSRSAGSMQAPPPAPPVASRPGAPAAGGRYDPLATSALVLAIAGVLILVLSLGIGFLFSLPFSITAWRLGVASRRRIAAGRYGSGDSVAQAGVVIGLIGMALGVVGMIVWSILVLNGLSLEEFQRDLERELERRREEAR